jgi:hypothetical protein
MVLLSIRLLGDLSAVDYRGNALSIGNRRTQALVVYLGMKIGSSPSIREIGELLFGDAAAAAQVREVIRDLRFALRFLPRTSSSMTASRCASTARSKRRRRSVSTISSPRRR